MSAPKILVLDHEPHITHMLCHKLEEAGAQMASGRDGREGLELVEQFKPDVIISDSQMPLIDGVTFARALAEKPARGEIPIILLTARGQRIPNAALAGTAVRYLLPKPFSIRDVLERIAELLPAAALQAGAPHA